MTSKIASSGRRTAAFTAVILTLGVLPGQAQAVPRHEAEKSLVDEDQTTYLIDRYDEVATSGPVRGETIYYYKCWVCHNALTQDAGPPLKNLFDRPVLMSGEPPNDETVAARTRQGGPRMPGFAALTDADMADLISYLRSENCCYEGEEPPLNPRYHAETHPWSVPREPWGGPTGVVRAASGQLLEGMKVQLIAPNGVRTTVFTDAEGRYEFPKLQAGAYTLRIATPVSYQSHRRERVRVEGANRLSAIVLEPVPEARGDKELPGALPPVQAVISQLSGAEMLWNLPGTAHEKAAFARTCGVGCHGYQQIFRNRFDEHGWRTMIDRMLGYQRNSLILRRTTPAYPKEEVETVIRWLAKVRGPDAQDMPLRQFHRPSGASTALVLTEYEMPRRLLSIHDTYGDAAGNIWYTSHRTPYQGVLDPRTGVVTEHKLPESPGRLPGAHAVVIDNERGIAWFSENWSTRYSRLDMSTGTFTALEPNNAALAENFDLAPDGSVWTTQTQGNVIVRLDPDTGEISNSYPLTNNPRPYQSAVSSDGRFWAGGSPATTGANTGMILDIRQGRMYEANSGDLVHSAARGGFEVGGHDAWFGGRDGVLAELVNKIDEGQGVAIRTYRPPLPDYPYTMFYSAMPDRNNEIWTGILQGRGFARYSTQTDSWVVYDNAEPSALARHTWIDNTTDPVSVWYPDFHTGLIVRIQPRPDSSGP
jgi:streptogramin lyase/cytochrome c2